MLDKAVWAELSSPTIDQQVCLKHLQHLILSLEEQERGSKLDGVPDAFRQTLGADLQAKVEAVTKLLDVKALLPLLRDLIHTHLATEVGVGRGEGVG